MIRHSLLWLSRQDSIFRLVRRNPLAWKFASRFVAGETIEEGVAVASQLAAGGITASLDLLGESVSRPEAAVAAKDEYLRMLDQMAAAGGLEVNVSVKLTQMGFDIDEALCLQNMREILTRAAALDGFVRLDMESSDYTQRTLDFFTRELHPSFGDHCGVVIQTALRRSEADIEQLIAMGARVRLCKGAYLEPPSVAFPDKADVDRNYIALMERLLLEGHYPGLATHDPAIITHAREFVARHAIPTDRFEFQMLYGVRRDLQHQLRDGGHRVRVYVAFGTQWYPYLMRRLAERPANIAFMMGNLVKESVSRR
jgi:proline dehydrogenase